MHFAGVDDDNDDDNDDDKDDDDDGDDDNDDDNGRFYNTFKVFLKNICLGSYAWVIRIYMVIGIMNPIIQRLYNRL